MAKVNNEKDVGAPKQRINFRMQSDTMTNKTLNNNIFIQESCQCNGRPIILKILALSKDHITNLHGN